MPSRCVGENLGKGLARSLPCDYNVNIAVIRHITNRIDNLRCHCHADAVRRLGRRARFRTWYPLRVWRFESSLRQSTVEYDFGLVEIEFMGEVTSGRVVFGPENCEPLLGDSSFQSAKQ